MGFRGWLGIRILGLGLRAYSPTLRLIRQLHQKNGVLASFMIAM